VSLRFRPVRTHLTLAAHFGSNYVKKYYLGTYLGLLWIPLAPALHLFLRGLVFGGFLGVSPGNRPYLVFLIIGSISWYFFDRTALWSYRALQYNRRYFRTLPVPWLPAVTGSLLPGLMQLLVYSLIAVVVCSYYKIVQGSFYVTFGAETAYALLGLVLLLFYAWALGLLLAPVVHVVRDVRIAVRYALAIWYLITPVLYSVDTIAPRYRGIAIFNPLTAPVELMRHGLLQMEFPATRSLVMSLVVLACLLPIGLVSFARAERVALERL
jgi:ABC-2 type transport system permease protein